MKTIIIFSTAYAPAIGGAEVAVSEITKNLTGRFRFCLITYRFNQSWKKHEQMGNVEVFRLGWGTKLDRWLAFPILAFFLARKLCRKEPAAMLWAVMVSYAGIGAYFLKLLNPELPLLLTLQEGDSEQHLTYGKVGLLGIWWKLMVRKADRIQAISNFLGERAKRLGARAEITVIPNGVEFLRFAQKPDEHAQAKLQQQLGIKDGDKIIVTSSRLVEKNAVDVSILALNHLPPNYRLLILGEGELKADLMRLAQEHHLGSRVVFAGSVAHKILPGYLHLGDVFVRPSRSEGLGNAFLESMAAGVPIIGTAVGGIPDFLADKQTGLFCRVDDAEDLAQKIKILIDDQRLRAEIMKNGVALVKQNYDWKQIAYRMSELFAAREKKAIKIVVASGTYPPQIGGMATFVKEFSQHAYNGGLHVEVLAYADETQTIADPFVVQIISRRGSKVSRYWRYFWTLRRLAAGADLIYAQDLISSGLPAAVAAFILRKKLIVRLGGDFLWEQAVETGKTDLPLRQYYLASKSGTERIYLWCYKFVLKQCCGIIFNSQFQADLYRHHFPFINSKPICVISNSIPEKHIKRGNNGGDFVYFGRLIKLKNLKRLLQAFSRLSTDKKLIFYGDGPQHGALLGQAEKLGLRGRVEIYSALPHDQVLEKISSCYALVVPALTEMNPQIVLEAISVGTPVLVTRENGLPSQIQKYLEIFDPQSVDELTQKMQNLLNPAAYQKYCQQIQNIDFSLSWPGIMQLHEQFFQKIV